MEDGPSAWTLAADVEDLGKILGPKLCELACPQS